MPASEQELRETHRSMTSDLAAQQARVKGLDPGTAEYDDHYRELIERAEALLTFEQALPGRLAEP